MKRLPRDYSEQNLKAARIIEADPMKYDGLPLEWARLVLGRLRDQVNDAQQKQARLFRKEAA